MKDLFFLFYLRFSLFSLLTMGDAVEWLGIILLTRRKNRNKWKHLDKIFLKILKNNICLLIGLNKIQCTETSAIQWPFLICLAIFSWQNSLYNFHLPWKRKKRNLKNLEKWKKPMKNAVYLIMRQIDQWIIDFIFLKYYLKITQRFSKIPLCYSYVLLNTYAFSPLSRIVLIYIITCSSQFLPWSHLGSRQSMYRLYNQIIHIHFDFFGEYICFLCILLLFFPVPTHCL